MSVSSRSEPKIVRQSIRLFVRVLEAYPDAARAYADAVTVDVQIRFKRAYRQGKLCGLMGEWARTAWGMLIIAPLKSKQQAAVPSVGIVLMQLWVRFVFACMRSGGILIRELVQPPSLITFANTIADASTLGALMVLRHPWTRFVILAALLIWSLMPMAVSISNTPEQPQHSAPSLVLPVANVPPSSQPVATAMPLMDFTRSLETATATNEPTDAAPTSDGGLPVTEILVDRPLSEATATPTTTHTPLASMTALPASADTGAAPSAPDADPAQSMPELADPGTATPSATVAVVFSPTTMPSATLDVGATVTASKTAMPSATSSATALVAATPSPTATPSATETVTPSATETATPSATVTRSATATAMPSATATATATVTPSATPSATPSETATASATATMMPTMTPSATITPSATPSNTDGPCAGYAQALFDQRSVEQSQRSLCAPDSEAISLGSSLAAELILDMGAGNELVDHAGDDLRFYESAHRNGISLDHIAIEVAPDDGTGRPGAFRTVFVWGDKDWTNNGSLPQSYIDMNSEEPEPPDQQIDVADLYQSPELDHATGISIDIGEDDNARYRFIRIRSYPFDTPRTANQEAQVDAIERIDEARPTPSPTSSPVPMV